jgi:hypothetical protein
VHSTKGLIIEQIRYESWECTDVSGQSRIEMTHDEILVNGTSITNTQCLLLTVSEDMQTSNQIYFDCDEEPDLDQFGYTSARLNSTVVPAPSNLTCIGSPVSLDTATADGPKYEGAGSVTEESTSLGDMFPPFESVNSNGYPDYRGAGGDPFSQGMYYRDAEEAALSGFSIAVGLNTGGSYLSSVRVVGTETGFRIFMAFLKYTGSERVTGEGEVYRSSAVSRRLVTNGTLGDAVAFCDLTDFTDPFKPLFAEVSSDGVCPETAAEAFPVQRLLAFPPQFDIEEIQDVPAAEELILASATDLQPEQGVNSSITTTGLFMMNKPNQQGYITFDLDVSNASPLSGSGGFTMAHIHAGNSSTVGGPAVVDLIPMLQNWPTPTTTDSKGHLLLEPPVNVGDRDLEFTGAFSSDQFIGPLKGKTMDEFVRSVKESDQNYYINVHTAEYPAGAIRAQLKAEPPSPAPSAAMSTRMGTLAAGTVGALFLTIM